MKECTNGMKIPKLQNESWHHSCNISSNDARVSVNFTLPRDQFSTVSQTYGFEIQVVSSTDECEQPNNMRVVKTNVSLDCSTPEPGPSIALFHVVAIVLPIVCMCSLLVIVLAWYIRRLKNQKYQLKYLYLL